MSKALDIAQGMKERLVAAGTVPATVALANLAVIIDRQLDIATEIEKAFNLAAAKGKGKGAMVTIFYSGFKNSDRSGAAYPKIVRSYVMSIYAAPVLGTNNTPADDILEAVATALHQWEPAAAHGIEEIHVASGDARADDQFLIYDLIAEVTSRL